MTLYPNKKTSSVTQRELNSRYFALAVGYLALPLGVGLAQILGMKIRWLHCQTLSSFLRRHLLWFMGAIVVSVSCFYIALNAFNCFDCEGPTIDTARHEIAELESAIDMYLIQKNVLPPPEELMNALKKAGIIHRAKLDPWGRPYSYLPTGDSFFLASWGPDGIAGTADDITNQDFDYE